MTRPRGSEARATQGDGHWTHRRPDLIPRGRARPLAKLTDDAVRTMHEERARGDSCREIARRHGVDSKTAWLALRGDTWRHCFPNPATKGSTMNDQERISHVRYIADEAAREMRYYAPWIAPADAELARKLETLGDAAAAVVLHIARRRA